MQLQKHKFQAYTVATQTVSSTKQIVLLYDGTIRFMQQAREALRENRIEERYNMLTKATEVITGLRCCLDFDKGGEMARMLNGFYAMLDSKIFSVHRTRSSETCDEVIADLKRMRDVWDEIDQSNAAGGNAAKKPVADTTSSSSNNGSDQSFTVSA